MGTRILVSLPKQEYELARKLVADKLKEVHMWILATKRSERDIEYNRLRRLNEYLNRPYKGK